MKSTSNYSDFYLYDALLLVATTGSCGSDNPRRIDIAVPRGKREESRLRHLGEEDIQNPGKGSATPNDSPVRYEALYHSFNHQEDPEVLAARWDIIVLPHKDLSRLKKYEAKQCLIDAGFPYRERLAKPYASQLMLGRIGAILSTRAGHPDRALLPDIEHVWKSLQKK